MLEGQISNTMVYVCHKYTMSTILLQDQLRHPEKHVMYSCFSVSIQQKHRFLSASEQQSIFYEHRHEHPCNDHCDLLWVTPWMSHAHALNLQSVFHLSSFFWADKIWLNNQEASFSQWGPSCSHLSMPCRLGVMLCMLILRAGPSSWEQQVHPLLPPPPPSDRPFPLFTSELVAVLPWSWKKLWFWAERSEH